MSGFFNWLFPRRLPVAITYVGDLQRIDIKPGDRFVLTVREVLSRDAMRRIHASWREFFKKEDDPPELLIVYGDARLETMPAVFDADKFLHREKEMAETGWKYTGNEY